MKSVDPVYLQPEVSNMNSLEWVDQDQPGLSVVPAATPLHTLCLFLFFRLMDLYQQTSEKVNTDLIKEE